MYVLLCLKTGGEDTGNRRCRRSLDVKDFFQNVVGRIYIYCGSMGLAEAEVGAGAAGVVGVWWGGEMEEVVEDEDFHLVFAD